jgi:hypothetical protein
MPGQEVAALRDFDLAYVSFGSLADTATSPRDVRFTPNSGHSRVRLLCPLSAIRDHFIQSKGFDRTHIHGTHVPVGGAVHSYSAERFFRKAT